MINIKNLNKYYHKGKPNEIHVINNTTLSLDDTGLICILGESGSGKTTLMNTISGLDDFHDGEIEVDGIEVHKFGDKNQEYVRNEKFGYIFQNYYLLQERTVEYNIMLALSLYDIPDEDKLERIDYVLRAVDMWKYKKRPVSQLSGGQQQRIAIARALAKSPKVIFADEPTGNLDEANTMRTMGILKKISKTCLVVVVTHERSIADFFADRILWIADGTVQKEIDKKETSEYQYVEDTNIYLGEYEKSTEKNGNTVFNVYANEEVPQINIKLICENGKIYIHTEEDDRIEFISNGDEKKVIDSMKPVVELSDLEDIEFELEHIEGAKRPKMSAGEIMDTAKSNIKSMGKKQTFLVVTLFVMAVISVLVVQNIFGMMKVDKQSVVTTDSHYYKVTAEKNAMITDTEYQEYFSEMSQAFMDGGLQTYVVPTTELLYSYSGYDQLETVPYELNDYSLVALDKITQKDLICGEMPKDNQEIVVDQWVLENFIYNSAQVSNFMEDAEQALGSKLVTSAGLELTISGISSTQEPTIYVDEDVMILLCKSNINFLTDEKAAAKYDDYEGAEIGIAEDGVIEVLIPESKLKDKFVADMNSKYSRLVDANKKVEGEGEWRRFSNDKEQEKYKEGLKENLQEIEEELGMTYEEFVEYVNSDAYLEYSYNDTFTGGVKYRVMGSFPKAYNIDYIIPDEGCAYIAKSNIDTYKQCYIYMSEDLTESQSKEEIMSKIPEECAANLNIFIVNENVDSMRAYEEKKNADFGQNILMLVTIVLISTIILYFMMKANAIARMQDLGVYRMLGISKMNIVGMFAYENFIITTYTSVIGVLITSFVTSVISKIPLLDIEMVCPWYAIVLTIIVLYALNIVVGIMPIRKMLKLPPAQLASKYDI